MGRVRAKVDRGAAGKVLMSPLKIKIHPVTAPALNVAHQIRVGGCLTGLQHFMNHSKRFVDGVSVVPLLSLYFSIAILYFMLHAVHISGANLNFKGNAAAGAKALCRQACNMSHTGRPQVGCK